jgi:OOP family OmpA-OmpF porin
MRIRNPGLLVILCVATLAACSKQVEAPPAEPAPPVAEAAPTAAAAPAPVPEAAAPAEFDVASVPQSTVTLPPFPFFKDPEGLRNNRQGTDAMLPFDRHGFLAGGKHVTQEGRIALFDYTLTNPDTARRYTELEFQKNYENAITALGGVKISSVQFTDEVVTAAGGREAIEKHWAAAAPPVPDAEHYTYLLRSADKEYWIHVSTGGIIPPMGFVTVLEKQAMQSALAFLDAAAMKKELDAKGHVALYINFDTDKATLRPDAEPLIAEVHKLLNADSALKLSIEGHTDNTGSAERNRELATARARSVLGALVGLGVDPARLASKGFGPDQPIADNATDAGRAKNRRVELVKVR